MTDNKLIIYVNRNTPGWQMWNCIIGLIISVPSQKNPHFKFLWHQQGRNTHYTCTFSAHAFASTIHAWLDVVIYTAAGVVGDKGDDDDLKDLRHSLFRVSQKSPATHGTFDAIRSGFLRQKDWLHCGIVCREVRIHLHTRFSVISPYIDNENKLF